MDVAVIDRATRRGIAPAGWAVALACWAQAAGAADLAEARELLRVGRYDECARAAADEMARLPRSEEPCRLRAEAEMARGKHAEALMTIEAGLRRSPDSIPLRLLGREAYLRNGQLAEAAAELAVIEAFLEDNPRKYATPEGRLAVGRFFLLKGADARKVLDQFLDPAIRARPDLLDAHLAAAELALGKQDDALAVATLKKAPKDAANDPRYQYALARAYADDDRAASGKAIADALAINPRHVDSLLLKAGHLIDSERYDEAEAVLAQAIEVDPREPRAWADRAVLAHLRSDADGESKARDEALAVRKVNPEVDHRIGRRLSQKYRFAEGSAYQRRAIEADGSFLPAKVQLCEDLLRLGDEAEGWKLADEVFAADGYNVVAYNLVTLRDRLAGFRTLRGEGLLVRMDPREADLYGDRVLDLLRRARETLSARYGVATPDPVIVEVFPQKKEFAVRTFGLPGADGLLGVCFGRVVTANSPASQGEHPANWEAVLWHEFCHVVTLGKTHNKMPRWLSEGISVYEEGRQDPAWGTRLSPHFRTMILGADLTPLSRLSSAFLAPKSGLHLQFAYYESSLAVEFLVGKAGLPALKDLLDDLGKGAPINSALPKRSGMTLEQLDREFAEFARGKAGAVAPGATWDTPELPDSADSVALAAWVDTHPRSFPGRLRLASRLMAEANWAKAGEALEALKTLDPDYVGEGNAYVGLAAIARKRDDPSAERAALEALAARDGDAAPAYLRLMDLDEKAGDWPALARDARRLLAVNPLIPAPHRQLALATDHLGQAAEALASYRALALLDETDPAETHFQIASLLRKAGKPEEARREVLRSLEEAPRFLDAHRLLLELVGDDRPKPQPPTPEAHP